MMRRSGTAVDDICQDRHVFDTAFVVAKTSDADIKFSIYLFNT